MYCLGLGSCGFGIESYGSFFRSWIAVPSIVHGQLFTRLNVAQGTVKTDGRRGGMIGEPELSRSCFGARGFAELLG